MRKIEENMRHAAYHNKKFNSVNTTVLPIDESNCAIYLHGNEIAVVNSNTGFVMVNKNTLRAYPTNTTKSRLRALGVNVYTKNHQVYLNNERI